MTPEHLLLLKGNGARSHQDTVGDLAQSRHPELARPEAMRKERRIARNMEQVERAIWSLEQDNVPWSRIIDYLRRRGHKAE